MIKLHFLAALVVPAVACVRTPAPRDPSGHVLLDRAKIPHPANTPFHCFTYTSTIGEQLSRCTDTALRCSGYMREKRSQGETITGPCTETKQVWCATGDRGDGLQVTECRAQEDHCEMLRTFAKSPMGLSMREDQVSACTMLDETFQPAA